MRDSLTRLVTFTHYKSTMPTGGICEDPKNKFARKSKVAYLYDHYDALN